MSGFEDPILTGDGSLIRNAAKSPNFVAASTGWSINADGTAEFNNVNVRGVLQSPNFVSGVSGWNLDAAGSAQLNGVTTFNGRLDVNGDLNIRRPWQTYTPIWTGSTGAPSFGNAAVRARWKNLGTLAQFKMSVTFGTTTNFGSGAWGFSLPVDPEFDAEGYSTASAIAIDDSATARYPGVAWLTNASGIFRVAIGGGGNPGISSAVPFAWAAGDTLIVSGSYQSILLA